MPKGHPVLSKIITVQVWFGFDLNNKKSKSIQSCWFLCPRLSVLSNRGYSSMTDFYYSFTRIWVLNCAAVVCLCPPPDSVEVSFSVGFLVLSLKCSCSYVCTAQWTLVTWLMKVQQYLSFMGGLMVSGYGSMLSSVAITSCNSWLVYWLYSI